MGWHQIYVINELIQIELELPIINQHKYETLKVFSLPNIATQSIIEVDNEFISVNYDLQAYFYPKQDEVKLNSEQSLTKESTFTRTNAILDKGDCIAATIFKQSGNLKSLCKRVSLPAEYDVWSEVYHHNAFIYYTSAPSDITVICNLTRYESKIKTGLLRAPPGCHIKTRNHYIITSTDISYTKKKIYLQPYDEKADATLTLNTISSTINNTINNISHAEETENLKGIRDEIQNMQTTAQKTQDTSKWFNPSAAEYISGLSLVAVIIFMYWKRKKMQTRPPQTRDSDNIDETAV